MDKILKVEEDGIITIYGPRGKMSVDINKMLTEGGDRNDIRRHERKAVAS